MEITFKDLQKKVRPNSPQVLKITKKILHHENVDQAILSVVFVSHQKMRALNKKYLSRDHVTDVLAFDLSEQSGRNSPTPHLSDNTPPKRNSKVVVGDIVISTDAALKHVSSHQTTLARELTLYVIHGILHLLGYDDHKSADAKKMRKKEKEILDYLGKKVDLILR